MHHKLVLVLVFLTPIFSKEKIHYSHSGYFTAATIHRLSDGSIIKIPYRILNYEPVLSFNNFSTDSFAKFIKSSIKLDNTVAL